MKKVLLGISIITASLLYAQVPTVSDIVKQVKPQSKLLKQKTKLIELPGQEKFKPSYKEDNNAKKILIKDFELEGNENIDTNKLLNLIKEYKNKNLSITQMKRVTSLITKEYRAQGYFVARAYIPVQKMQDGILKITIIEGNYGEFKLNNNSNVKDFVVQGMLNDIKDKKIVSTKTLERAMLIINETPGVQVTQADATPGEAVGTSNFDITAESTPWYNGYILLDNYGSRYTEKNRLSVGGNLNNPFKIGDQISFTGLLSKKEKIKNGRLAYNFPLMYNGLRGEVSYNLTDYALTEEYASLNADGRSKSLEFKVSYPIVKTRLESLILSSTYANKSLKDYQDDVITANKSIDSINISLDYLKTLKLLEKDSELRAGFTFTMGHLDFKDSTSKANDKAGDNTQGHYDKINGYVGLNLLIDPLYSVNTTLKFQKALGNKNLDGSEDMSLGGAYGIKAFPDSESSAENGLMLNLEVTRRLPVYNNIYHEAGIFYDIGKVSMQDDSNNTTFERRSLQDVGISYSAYYKDFFLNTKLARVVGGNSVTSEKENISRLLFQLGWRF